MARSKYGAKPIVIDGIRFASQAEGRRYSELRLFERAGRIRQLELQPEFPIVLGGKKVATYKADFAYFAHNSRVVEDVKSAPTKTPLYRLKKRLVEALYPGVTITEVGT